MPKTSWINFFPAIEDSNRCWSDPGRLRDDRAWSVGRGRLRIEIDGRRMLLLLLYLKILGEVDRWVYGTNILI